MKQRRIFSALLWFLLAVAPAAFARVWYVDGVNGNDNNDCKTRQTACKTIGHAVSLASSGDTIGVGPATYTENLTIAINLNLIGSGASTTIIDGGGVNTVVTISNTATNVVISKFTVRNGKASYGGGIYNRGILTINNSTISGNSASFAASGDNCSGGGVFNNGTLTINHTTISNNQAAGGGGICTGGAATISNSTLSGNRAFTSNGSATPAGGGISGLHGTLTINNSTISGNSASQFNDHGFGGRGGGIYGSATVSNSTISGNSIGGFDGGGGGGVSGRGGFYRTYVTLQNSIVANDSPVNCGPVTSYGYNLSSDTSCTFNGPGDLNNTDPKLGPLQNNGGPTQTQALLPGSSAIDAGNPNGCTDGNGHLLTTDQRGAPRPDKEDSGGCDMGAFERQRD